MRNKLNSLLEKRIYNHEDCVSEIEKLADKQTLDFAKWIDKNYYQGDNGTYAKSKEDFRNKETSFSIKQLFVIFKRGRD